MAMTDKYGLPRYRPLPRVADPDVEEYNYLLKEGMKRSDIPSIPDGRGVGFYIPYVIKGVDGLKTGMSKTARALHLWKQMSDERLRSHSSGLSFRTRSKTTTLNVYVDSNAWMYEFGMRQGEFLAEWRELCRQTSQEDLLADRMEFKLSKAARENGYSAGYNNHPSSGDAEPDPVPLSPEELSEAIELVSHISDKRRREHALKAIIAIKQWKKANQ